MTIRLGAILTNAVNQEVEYDRLHEQWLHSQYNLNNGYEFLGNMLDPDLYTYASLDYMRGGDPSRVNYETPPTGKYLFGLGFLLSGKIMSAQWLATFTLLGLLLVMANRIGLSWINGLLVCTLVVFDPLIFGHFKSVNMEILVAVVVLAGLGLLDEWLRNRRMSVLWLLGATIGLLSGIKFFALGVMFGVYVMMILWIATECRAGKRMKNAVTVGLSAIWGYLVAYGVYFGYHGVSDFVRLQVSMIRLYRSYLPEYPWFEIWRIAILGKWNTWFAEPRMQRVAEYWLLWPVSIFTGFLGLRFKRLKRKQRLYYLLIGWVTVYMLFSSVHVVFPRYLITVLPITYLLTVATLAQIVGRKTTSGVF